MNTGKLYSINDTFVGNVRYHLNESPTDWWGELTFIEYVNASDGTYTMVLEDKRKG